MQASWYHKANFIADTQEIQRKETKHSTREKSPYCKGEQEKKKETKELQSQKIITNLSMCNSFLSIITSNLNGLKLPKKDYLASRTYTETEGENNGKR